MAVYFDHRAQAPNPGQNTDIQWHKNFSVLAVASYSETTGGSVNLFLEEGDHESDSKIRKSRPASILAWHPLRRVLAIGWETGEVTIWNDTEHEMYEVPPLHKGEITILQWTSNGTKLLTGDVLGVLALWKADSRGRIQQVPLYHDGLNEQLTCCVLKPPPPADPSTDIASLARAAVSGDESALDMFSYVSQKDNKGNARPLPGALGPQEAVTFFIGGKNGTVYFLNDNHKLVQQYIAEGPVRKLLFYEEKSVLITITTNMMLTQHSVSQEGETREILKVKLSGRSDHPDTIWAGKGVLATCTGEGVLRMWDLEKEENYILNLESNNAYDRSELIMCISYCSNKGILAGGMGSGHIAMWKYSPAPGAAGNRQEPEDRWKLQPPCTIDGPISELAWGSSKNLLALNTVDEVFILSEQIMSAHYCDQTSVVQTGPMVLAVDVFATTTHHDLKTDIQVKGVHTTKESIAIWDGRKIVVYEISGDSSLIRPVGTVSTESSLCCLYEQNLYTLEPGKIQVRTFQGTVKQLLMFTEQEGDPVCMEVCGHFLVVGSTNGFLKIFDLSRREAKQHTSPKNLAEHVQNFGSVVSVKCNCNGSRVSTIVSTSDGKADPKIYVWDIELDTVQFFSFESGRGEQDEFIPQTADSDQDASDADRGKSQAAKDIAGRHPIGHYWDTEEPKLLVCETHLLPQDQQQKEQEEKWSSMSLTKATMDNTVEVMVVSLFATQENGIMIQDSFAMSTSHNGLLGVQVPFYYFTKKADQAQESETTPMMGQMNGQVSFTDRPLTAANPDFKPMVSRRVMRDFVGLEMADKGARDAMMNFSYYLTIGNMDEAFKAIKLIKSESVWENMAQMCVKNRRLDVATVCLGNMGHARGAKALREAGREGELDARVATLAMQLGLQEDAERLLKNCKRYDLLNEYYQCSNQWGKALETAEMYDRIHLRTTYYSYAKHLESKGDIQAAIPIYEKSETHRFEVPRMLFDEPAALEGYIMKTKDKALRKWWAQYMESTGEMETALQFYEASKDFLSLVRVYCYCGNIEKAAEMCNETGDRAGCYHLARQYENNGEIQSAIHFFTRAQAYGNAIRLCRDHGNEGQIMNLALLSRPEDMIEAARYYETRPGGQDKAVMLYHKAGYFSKALDLAFESKQFAALQVISEDLDETTDPQLLQRCADFFIENSQFDRAVDLLGAAKKYWEALKICMEQHVPMTEELVEKLTPGKGVDSDERNKIMEGIAEVCMQQRQYHLATKKYTQAGNKVKAMKALLKSGDTEKIVFFAGVSRQKEIYVMAANYLQSLDWRKDPEIMKNIIGFYTKGRALDSLSSFYDACAQVEIDEYENYEKALGAMSEAYKCLTKATMKNQSLQEDKQEDLKRRITLIKKFVQIQRAYQTDAEDAIKQCQAMLQESNIDSAVRPGHIYGLMISHHARKEKYRVAYNLIEDLRSRVPKASVQQFVDIKTLEAIYKALDMPLKGLGQRQMNGYSASPEEEDGEEVEEDVVDEIYDED